MERNHAVTVACALIALCCMAFTACSANGPGEHSLAAIKQRGTLVVLTRNAPTTYYIGNRDKPTGPEYDMVVAFAKAIGVEPKFIVMDSVSELLSALAGGRGDMIAGSITRTPARTKHFDFGPTYQEVTQQVVCGRGGPSPDSPDELQGVELEVIANSSYVERLKSLQQKYPDLDWKTTRTENTETLLREVWDGKLACTVADSNIVAINRRYFPNLVPTFALGKPQHLAWVLPSHQAGSLRRAMDHWMRRYKESGKLQALMEHYYGDAQVFDYVGVRAFRRKIRHVWPRYREVFYQAAEKHDLPPLILAAQAYQESHWNPHARSPTGVRGMMMLTLDTAGEFGVDNRLDPIESIRGGARYLAHLERRLDDSIPQPQRIWFALAAYNIGLYHLRDARDLTQKLGKNPNSWPDVSEILPLLSDKRYYRHLPYGYARGLQPVRYVRRIRNYADILRVAIEETPTT